jgi:hypothetical protein
MFIIQKFGKIDLCQQNWPNDPKLGCKSPFSLVDFVETNANLEEKLKELEEFEGAFERDEVMEL